MVGTVGERLCARLVGTVATKSADEFYREFTLTDTSYCEYHFHQMKEIFHLPGMDKWVMLDRTDDGTKEEGPINSSPPILFSLVCFVGPATILSNEPNFQKVKTAHDKARRMLYSTFEKKDDRDCIDVAMANNPTIAIFMCRGNGERSKKKNRNKKSIFDGRDANLVHCLAAVNYFRHGTNTQVLWLATTLEKPPVDSIQLMWHKLGLGTYLLCMLVKQHTGISKSPTLDDSILCLQASQKRTNTDIQSRRFYLKLGFICHDEFKDNGLSETSEAFQMAVHKFSKLWVFPERECMSFFRLCKGRINFLPRRFLDCSESVCDSMKTYSYATFPWPCHSMKRIEEYLDTRPILRSLSDEPLPITDRPLMVSRSMSNMSGRIHGSTRKSLNSQSWLRTDEDQFLFAFLL
jgi:hypothetical protein